MRITYISHASLLIEADGIRIVTDPWYDGPAYGGQWNVFPKPVDDSIARSAEYVVLTHGHEDHLHEPTLRRIAGGKTALYPFYWYAGAAEHLSGLGFERVIELESGRTHRLTPRVSLTFIVNGQDSIAVIEDGE